MWPFSRKHANKDIANKDIYKVTYVIACDVTDKAFVFQKSNMHECYVEASSLLDAQVVFAQKCGVMLSPHTCIDRITKVNKV